MMLSLSVSGVDWLVSCFITVNRAMMIQGEEDDKGNVEPLSILDFVLHFLTFFWKVLFAFIPPR